ncbi:ubiquinone/menaquinone biosynthesis C-methylase UbiE [Actinomycetospora succinea]|uniref:Ubiquinone/menaquinone biosynthesis C-methylase UbiE n=1 Tax=Actinomycetospora succinea TaxID=663603 RepID=A0A4V3D895_9PSEU|nr:class I SAM-dependent methyltransferase [Actinomycetospora succinea]TDQ50807.1 ubiquinone/menaquinone biosynthesis C-methylase UbiE [Actinomycetospora succinea]
MSDLTVEHYERVAPDYDEHWSYDPDYVRRFTQAIVDSLRLTRSDAIADVGCGTGLYTRRLAAEVEPERPILCVDPVPAMLERVPSTKSLQPLAASAEDLASGRVAPPGRLDAIVLKESFHHVAEREETLEGLAGLLSRHGRILIVMLPRTIHHPLFREAHERFGELQPEPAKIVDMVSAVGLRAAVSYRTFHTAIDRERYVRMLESRYMSVLGEFSDDELRAGIEQFRHAYRNDPVLRFDDHFAFIKGWVKPG